MQRFKHASLTLYFECLLFILCSFFVALFLFKNLENKTSFTSNACAQTAPFNMDGCFSANPQNPAEDINNLQNAYMQEQWIATRVCYTGVGQTSTDYSGSATFQVVPSDIVWKCPQVRGNTPFRNLFSNGASGIADDQPMTRFLNQAGRIFLNDKWKANELDILVPQSFSPNFLFVGAGSIGGPVIPIVAFSSPWTGISSFSWADDQLFTKPYYDIVFSSMPHIGASGFYVDEWSIYKFQPVGL